MKSCRTWQAIFCRRDLILLVSSWLWHEIFSTWADSREVVRISSRPDSLEPSTAYAESMQTLPIPQGGDVITATLGSVSACKLPRPCHVTVEGSQCQPERFLNEINGEADTPIVRLGQLKRTGVIVMDTGCSTDVI